MTLKKFITGPIGLIAHNAYLLSRTTIVELRIQYAGSLLGMFWVVLGPILLLSIYTAVYAFIFRVRPETLTVEEYILYVFSGLVPFLAFSASLTQGAMALASNKQVLLSTVFPPDLLPVRSVLIASLILPVGLCLIIAADVIWGTPSLINFLVVPFLILQIMFLSGIAWILSLLTIVIRDIQQLLQYATILLLIITPIAYTPDMIPKKLQLLIYANPLCYYTTTFQYIISYEKLPPNEILLGTIIISLMSFYGGFWIFQKIKASFYDYV